MKLTEKAVDEFVENSTGFTHPSKWDFEPTDFEDCVVLTRKEAKELIDLLSHAEDQRRMPYSYDACDEWALKLTNALKEMK